MTALQKLIVEARALTPEERRELVAELEQLDDQTRPVGTKRPRYAHTLALSGAGRSDHSDVSADNYARLGDAFRHEG